MKNLSKPIGENRSLMKILFKMKLTFLFLLTGLITVSASSYSQNTRLDVNVKNNSLVDLFKEIEENSEFYFFYQKEELTEQENISVTKKNAKVTEILDEALDGTALEYKIVDRYIIIRKDGKGLDNVEAITRQQKSISGIVTDESGEPLPGVTVLIKGTTNGTVSDINGNYSISDVSSDAVLVFSFVGMLSQEITIDNKTSINITLFADAIGIEEVIAVGYGTMKKSDLTGSVGVAKSKDFLKSPITQAGQALQGRIAGVQVTIPGGKPGEDQPEINIRGIGSFGASDNPLVLVDGLESSFNAVSPGDIETITVLKDASACAIYGARAANGVILIDTKKGGKEEASIAYEGYYGFQKVYNLYDMCNATEFATLLDEARVNAGRDPYFDAPGYTPDTFGEGTDWIDEVFRSAAVMNHHISLTGGNKTTNYAVLGNYLDQEGVMHGADYKRYSVRVNLNSTIKEFVKFGINVTALRSDKSSSTGSGGWQDNAWVGALRANPLNPVYNPDGSWGTPRPRSEYPGEFFSLENPVQQLYLYTNDNQTNHFSGISFVEAELFKDFVLKVSGGIDFDNRTINSFIPTYEFKYRGTDEVYRSKATASADKSTRNYTKWSNENILTYKKEIKKHKFDVMGGVTFQAYKSDDMYGQISNFPGNNIEVLDAGTEINKLTGGAEEWSLMSYLGRINYSFDNKYLFQANVRHDGSSRLAPENRWKTFPSFSAGWRVSEESFWPEDGIVNNLKIRGSWGKLGNQEIGLYPYISNLDLNQNYIFGTNQSMVQGIAPTSIANRDLQWEIVTMSNVGVDLNLLDNMFYVEADYFTKKTSDILQRSPIPSSVGIAGAPYQNVGELMNKGVEFSTTFNKTFGDLNVSVSANCSYIENEVTKLANDGEDIISGVKITRVGEPLNSLYGYVFDGIFQNQQEVDSHVYQEANTAPGDIRFKNLDGDDNIDGDDRQIIGQAIPKFYYGGSINLDYKNFDFSVFFQGIGNRDVYVDADNFGRDIDMNNERNIPAEFLQRWTGEGSTNDFPRLVWNDNDFNDNGRDNSRWIENGRYLRIKTINLGYTLPSHLLNSVKLDHVRLYLTAQNLFTFTSYQGMEPETTSYNPVMRTYPQPSSVLLGINVKF